MKRGAAWAPNRGITLSLMRTICKPSLDKLKEHEFKAGRYRYSEENPSSIEEAREIADADGTASIFDIDLVGQEPDSASSHRCRIEAHRFVRHRQTSRAMIEGNLDLYEEIDRGQGICIVAYDGNKPSEIFFGGYSYDWGSLRETALRSQTAPAATTVSSRFAQGLARLDGGLGGGQRRDAGHAVRHGRGADLALVGARPRPLGVLMTRRPRRSSSSRSGSAGLPGSWGPPRTECRPRSAVAVPRVANQPIAHLRQCRAIGDHRSLVAVGHGDEHRAPWRQAAAGGHLALGERHGKVSSMPMTSPVECISGPRMMSTPGNLLNGKTLSLTEKCFGITSSCQPQLVQRLADHDQRRVAGQRHAGRLGHERHRAAGARVDFEDVDDEGPIDRSAVRPHR